MERRPLSGMPRRLGTLFAPLLVLSLIACGPTAARRLRSPSPGPVATSVASVEVPREATLVGCDAADRAKVDAEIIALGKTIRELKPGDAYDEPTRRIAALWAHPCLPTLARFFAAPEPKSAEALIDVWERGLDEALFESVGGLYRAEGEPASLVVPPEVVPEPPADALAKAASWICPPDEPSCARSKSYVASAERAFDAWRELSRRDGASEACKDAPARDGARTAFERWALCVFYSVPETTRYPRISLRAPTSGWVILTGRRGHYQFSDEARAYDLASGAAYVVSSTTKLVLKGGDVDAAATDAARVPVTGRGEVAPDQVRDLAFLLGTKSLPVRYRERVMRVPVPARLAFEIARGEGRLPWQREGWRTSAQTKLSYVLIEGKRRTEGLVTWPAAADVTDTHIDQVIGEMEEGLVTGCPRARPPSVAGASVGVVSSVDAAPDAFRQNIEGLEKLLDAFAASPCRGKQAKRPKGASAPH